MIYVQWEMDIETAKFRLGLLCCATTLVFCAAPLASLVINPSELQSKIGFNNHLTFLIRGMF